MGRVVSSILAPKSPFQFKWAVVFVVGSTVAIVCGMCAGLWFLNDAPVISINRTEEEEKWVV